MKERVTQSTPLDSVTFAMISIWRIQPSGNDNPPQLECVNQYEIHDPVFLNPASIHPDTIHLGSDKE